MYLFLLRIVDLIHLQQLHSFLDAFNHESRKFDRSSTESAILQQSEKNPPTISSFKAKHLERLRLLKQISNETDRALKHTCNPIVPLLKAISLHMQLY